MEQLTEATGGKLPGSFGWLNTQSLKHWLK